MINCPYCGQPVLEGQRFCGSCGKEVPVQPAVRAAPAAPVAPVFNNPPPSEGQAAPYAYAQPSGYSYEPLPPTQPPMAGRMIVVIGAVLLALCCTLAFGICLGFEIIPTLLEAVGMRGAAPPAPRPTVSPSSLLPIIQTFFNL